MNKIAIFGVPRSGTSWLSQIFNSNPSVALRFQPLFSYSHKACLNEMSTGNEVNEFFVDILNTNDEFALMKAPMFHSYPKFVKSTIDATVFKETLHLNVSKALLKNSNAKVVAIIRNPISVLASWVKAPKEFAPDWDILKEWRNAPSKNKGPEYYYGFDKWLESTLMFIDLAERYPTRCLIIDYHELNSNTMSVVEDAFIFCGLTLDRQTKDFIVASKSRNDSDPYSVYKNKNTDDICQKVLPEIVIDTIKTELLGTKLEKYIK